jgi:hypothetical protein
MLRIGRKLWDLAAPTLAVKKMSEDSAQDEVD